MKKKLIFIFPITAIFLFVAAYEIFAADGSGTNTVSPNSVIRSSTGNTLTFTFIAAETMDSGEARIKAPNSSGWSTPQGSAGVNGYTTATVSGSGTVASVLSNADSTTGWTQDDPDVCNVGFGLDTATFKEGTGSIYCNNTGNTGADATDSFGFDFTAQNWSSYTKAGFWVRSSVATASGDIQAAIDNNNDCSSPIEEFNVPALAVNTWTYVKWTFAGAGSTRTSVTTFCFNAGSNSAFYNKRIWVDDLLIAPGALTFPVNGADTDIAARFLSLATGEIMTVIYGNGGGASGVAAPSVAGSYTFTTRTRTSSSGTLTNISSSPVVTVNNPVPTTTSISPTSKTVYDNAFTLTVNGTNFVSDSTARFNGSNRTTTFVSSTQLTASIPASDLLTAGTFNIDVVNATPGGGTSNSQTFTVNNPVPTTTSISPNSKTVGDSGFTLTVNGSLFVSSSVARFNGSNRTTTFINSTQLTATIPASDLTSVGTFPITVFNTTPGGGTSNSQTFTVNVAPDTTSPSAISNLAASNPTTSTVDLSWTAPGDDGSVGTA
ncbi:hypothetical protein HY249_03445, partial [Candidatus Azambacteria bacterium]|nr:hypothetical protein [Candidatus Azambacteria bacterium]